MRKFHVSIGNCGRKGRSRPVQSEEIAAAGEKAAIALDRLLVHALGEDLVGDACVVGHGAVSPGRAL
jgi:hypothetical protein